MLDESEWRAPIELEFAGASGSLPQLIAVEQGTFSVVVAADPPGSGRFTSPALGQGVYVILPWHPVLGSWKETIRHGPGSPPVHRQPAPEAGTLWAEVALPEGVRPADVELSVTIFTFQRFVMGRDEGGDGRHVLPWNEEHGAFVGMLPLGGHLLTLRGGGLAEEPTGSRSSGERRHASP